MCVCLVVSSSTPQDLSDTVDFVQCFYDMLPEVTACDGVKLSVNTILCIVMALCLYCQSIIYKNKHSKTGWKKCNVFYK